MHAELERFIELEFTQEVALVQSSDTRAEIPDYAFVSFVGDKLDEVVVVSG
jgi:hypothetical protein